MIGSKIFYSFRPQRQRSKESSKMCRTLDLKIWADIEFIEIVSEPFPALLYRPIAVADSFVVRPLHEGLPDVEVLGILEVGVPER